MFLESTEACCATTQMCSEQRSTGRTWKEAQNGLIELDEEAEDVFGAFWGWLYNSGALPSRPLDDGYTYELAQDCYDLLSRLWLFANFRNIHLLKDQVINEIIGVWIWGLGADCFPESDVVNRVYENTMDGSPLRELLRDMLVYYQHMLDVIDPEVEDHQDFCSEFMRDVAVALAKNTQSRKRRARSETQWEEIDRCQYHVHPALN